MRGASFAAAAAATAAAASFTAITAAIASFAATITSITWALRTKLPAELARRRDLRRGLRHRGVQLRLRD